MHPTPEKLIEALIFASDRAIGLAEIAQVMAEIQEEQLEEADIQRMIDSIRARYDENGAAIGLVYAGDGYQFLTRKEY